MAKTGPASFIGEPEGRLLEALIGESPYTNPIPGIGQLRLLIRDSGGNAAQAQIFLDEFIGNSNVIAVIGPSTSGEALPLAARAYENQIPLLALAANKRIVEHPQVPNQVNPWVFKFAQNDDLAAEKLVGIIRSQRGLGSVGFFYSDDGFGNGGSNVFAVAVSNAPGVSLAFQRRFPVTLQDAQSVVENLPDNLTAVVVWSTTPAVVPIVSAIRQRAPGLPIYLSHGNASDAFIASLGPAGEGVYVLGSRVLVPPDLLSDSERDQIIKGFQNFWISRFSDPPSHFAGHARDALAASFLTLGPSMRSRQDFRDALERLRAFPGVTGTFTFSPQDHAGLDRSAFELFTIRGGRFVLVTDEFRFISFSQAGPQTFQGAFTNGVVTIEQRRSFLPGDRWVPLKNVYTTSSVAEVALALGHETAFYRARKVDLSNGREGFTNLVESYSTLTTMAGAGGATGTVNKWEPAFENGPATNARLSRPHIAMSDAFGNIFIADKESHGIRKVRPDGTIRTVAGINRAGNGSDEAQPGTQVALNEPNGLWVRKDGTVYILDLMNGKIRRLDTNGLMTLLFSVPGGITAGRGLWVSDDETVAYVSSGTVVKKWTPQGVSNFASGFSDLGNLAVDPSGDLVVTDRGGHAVYRISGDGSKTRIAGNETVTDSPGGGDGGLAMLTGLNQVRAIWFLPTGAYLLGTEGGSQVWYVDLEGKIHLLLHGDMTSHAGDGSNFYQPNQPRIGKVRQITATPEGDLLISENDAGYVRRVRFLRSEP